MSQAAKTYELSCNDCSYEATVRGDLAAVYGVLDDHEERRADGGFDHFVDCRLADDPD